MVSSGEDMNVASGIAPRCSCMRCIFARPNCMFALHSAVAESSTPVENICSDALSSTFLGSSFERFILQESIYMTQSHVSALLSLQGLFSALSQCQESPCASSFRASCSPCSKAYGNQPFFLQSCPRLCTPLCLTCPLRPSSFPSGPACQGHLHQKPPSLQEILEVSLIRGYASRQSC